MLRTSAAFGYVLRRGGARSQWHHRQDDLGNKVRVSRGAEGAALVEGLDASRTSATRSTRVVPRLSARCSARRWSGPVSDDRSRTPVGQGTARRRAAARRAGTSSGNDYTRPAGGTNGRNPGLTGSAGSGSEITEDPAEPGLGSDGRSSESRMVGARSVKIAFGIRTRVASRPIPSRTAPGGKDRYRITATILKRRRTIRRSSAFAGLR